MALLSTSNGLPTAEGLHRVNYVDPGQSPAVELLEEALLPCVA